MDRTGRRAHAPRGRALPQLQNVRLLAMLKQNELAGKADVSPATVMRAERGAIMSIDTARKLAHALGVAPGVLCGDVPMGTA